MVVITGVLLVIIYLFMRQNLCSLRVIKRLSRLSEIRSNRTRINDVLLIFCIQNSSVNL